MTGPKKLLLIVALPFFLASCATGAFYAPIDESVLQGNYKGGLAQVQAGKETNYSEKDKILYYLDAGLLAHYAGEYKESSALLGDGERAIEAAFTKSVSREVGSYLVNDTTKEYPGEDYEDIYLNVFNALNYYRSGSLEGALVEIRRVNNKIKFLSTKYGTEISGAQSALMEKSDDIPYDPNSAKVNFTDSALARYLAMLFYRGEGKMDDARIDRDGVKLAFANHPAMYTFGLPSSLNDELSIPRGKARLNVISFNGLGPVKTQNTTRIQFSDTKWLKIAIPEISKRPSMITRTEVVFDDGSSFVLEPVEDLSAVATETFKQRATLIYLKTVLRSIVKTASSIAMEEAAKNSSDSNTQLMLQIASLSTQVYAEASEQADLRLARYFPAKALVGGITLDPGVYSFNVRYYNSSGLLINEIPFKNIQVDANKLNLSEAICIK